MGLNQGTFIFGCIMSLAALAQEKFWENKAQCEDAEKAYYSRLSGAKVDKIEANAGGAGASADVLKKLKDLELENKDLKKVTSDLKAMVLKLEGRVAAIEKGKPAAAAAAPKLGKKDSQPMQPKNPRNPPLSPRPRSCSIANLGTMKPTWTSCSRKLRKLKWTDFCGVLANLFPLDTASANSR